MSLRYVGICNDYSVANFVLGLAVKYFWKSINISRSYRHGFLLAQSVQTCSSMEGCGCVAEGCGTLTFWLRLIRFFRGLRGIFCKIQSNQATRSLSTLTILRSISVLNDRWRVLTIRSRIPINTQHQFHFRNCQNKNIILSQGAPRSYRISPHRFMICVTMTTDGANTVGVYNNQPDNKSSLTIAIKLLINSIGL